MQAGTRHRNLGARRFRRSLRLRVFGAGAGAGMEPAARGQQDRRRHPQPARIRDAAVHGDLRRRVRLHVLFRVRAPQVERPQGGAVPREHHRGDPLDGDPAGHPDRHRLPATQDRGRAEGHLQPGPHHQGHGLPVEVGLRLRQGRGRGHQLRFHARDAARSDREPGAEGRELPARSRQRTGGAGGQEDPHADHRRRRDPLLVGAGLRRQAGRDSGLHPRPVVPRRQDRHLPQPVRRAVRQGTWLHADRGTGGDARTSTANGWATGRS